MMIPPILATAVAVVAVVASSVSSGLFQKIVARVGSSMLRVPVYQLTSQKASHPSISWTEGTIQATWRAAIHLDKNEHSFIRAEVHAASFDIFYPTRTFRDWDWDWDWRIQQQQTHQRTRLVPIGNVRDNHNRTNDRAPPPFAAANNSDANTLCTTSSTSRHPIWTLHPRQPFDVEEDLTVSLSFRDIPSLARLVWSLLVVPEERGETTTLTIPSTGVAHVRAGVGVAIGMGRIVNKLTTGAPPTSTLRSTTPLTIGIVCENAVHINLRTMMTNIMLAMLLYFRRPHQQLQSQPSIRVVGKECNVNKISQGWIDFETEQERLREYACRRYDETGSVLLLKK